MPLSPVPGTISTRLTVKGVSWSETTLTVSNRLSNCACDRVKICPSGMLKLLNVIAASGFYSRTRATALRTTIASNSTA